MLKNRPSKRRKRRDITLYLMILPGLAIILVFAYLPMFGYIIAFEDYQPHLGFLKSPWVGFKNLKFFLTSADFLRITRNTLWLNLLFIITGQTSALLLAVSLNEIRAKTFKRIAQSASLLPFLISWVVVATMVAAVFSNREGLLNSTLSTLGLPTISWYNEPGVWPWLLSFLHIWKSAGFGSVIYLAAITSIPEEIYESARVDGATRFQQIYMLTIPLLMPTVAVMLLLALGRIFYGNFGMIYNIVRDNGLLFSTTDVIDTYIYRSMRTLGDFGRAGAVGLFQSFIGLVFVLTFNAIIRKINPEARVV